MGDTTGSISPKQEMHNTNPPESLRLSPFAAVTKFCYKFVKREYQQAIASTLFDGGKIWARSWNLHAAWNPSQSSAKSLLFVPERQLQDLVAEIDRRFPSARVGISQQNISDGLVIDFGFLPADLRPQFLGTSNSREEYDQYAVQDLRQISFAHVAQKDFEAYQDLLVKAVQIGKNKIGTAARKEMIRQERNTVRMSNQKMQLIRTQQLLGFLPAQSTLVSSETPLVVDIEKPPSGPFADDAILIAIDIEAKERNKHAITEVGISTLDTRDLSGVAPGQSGKSWQSLIQARHIRVTEHRHHVNHEFLRGCPGAFEFGTSVFVNEVDLPFRINEWIRNLSGAGEVASSAASDSQEASSLRNVVLVGHNISADIDYLRQIGLDITGRKNVIEVMDTQDIYKAVTNESSPCSLGAILATADLMGWNLHNAGNDAVYTLWALLALIIQKLED